MSVAFMQPRADGAVEFVLFERRNVPDLRVKGGDEWGMKETLTVSQLIRWREGGPLRVLGKSIQVTGPRLGFLPLQFVPVEWCSPPGSPLALDARQVEGEQVVWCSWNDPATVQSRVEGRVPFQPAPLTALRFDDPESIRNVYPLSGQRAVVERNGRAWLLDARTGAARLLIDREAMMLGATPEGDVLLSVEHKETVLVLQSGKVLPLAKTATQVVGGFGSVWIFDGTTKRLLRVSPDAETVSEVPRPIGFGDLLGADVAGWLWFSSMSGIVKAGEPLPVWRWNPQTGEQRQVALPTN